jgi:hypothetical protein
MRTEEMKDAIDYGRMLAEIVAIRSIIENMEYPTDAVKAIKCVLGMFEEEEKE